MNRSSNRHKYSPVLADSTACTFTDPETGEDCDCPELQFPTDTIELAACHDCGHGSSHHDGSKNSPEGSRSAPKSSNVDSIIHAVLSRAGAAGVDPGRARQEALKGLRSGPPEVKIEKGKSKGKGKAIQSIASGSGSRTAEPNVTSKSVRVKGVVVITAGLNEKGELRETKVPDADMNRLKAIGLVVEDVEADSKGITWAAESSKLVLADFLKKLLPAVFEYLDERADSNANTSESDMSNSISDSDIAHRDHVLAGYAGLNFVLCSKTKHHLSVVPLLPGTTLTGSQFHAASMGQRTGVGWRTNTLFIATRKRIDLEAYESWYKKRFLRKSVGDRDFNASGGYKRASASSKHTSTSSKRTSRENSESGLGGKPMKKAKHRALADDSIWDPSLGLDDSDDEAIERGLKDEPDNNSVKRPQRRTTSASRVKPRPRPKVRVPTQSTTASASLSTALFIPSPLNNPIVISDDDIEGLPIQATDAPAVPSTTPGTNFEMDFQVPDVDVNSPFWQPPTPESSAQALLDPGSSPLGLGEGLENPWNPSGRPLPFDFD